LYGTRTAADTDWDALFGQLKPDGPQS